MNIEKRLFIIGVFVIVALLLGSFGYFYAAGDLKMDSGDRAAVYSLPEGKTLSLNRGWAAFTDNSSGNGEVPFSNVFGTGEYYLKLNLETLGMQGNNAFLINPLYSAYTLEINGSVVANAGVPSSGPDTEVVYAPHPLIVPFSQQDDDLELVLHISNFSHRFGGSMLNWISYGRYSDVESMASQGEVIDLLIVLALACITMLHLYNFNYLSKKPYSMYFFLLSFLFTLYAMFSGRVLAVGFIPALGGGLVYRVEEILIIFMSPVLFNYFRSLFPDEIRKPAIVVSNIIAVGTAVAGIIVPLEFLRVVAGYYAYMLIAAAGFLLWRLAAAVRAHRTGARLTLASFSFMYACLLHDYAFTFGLFNSKRLAFVGIAVFALQQTYRLVTDNISYARDSEETHMKLAAVMNQKENFIERNSVELDKPIRNIVELGESLLRGSIGPLNSEQIATSSLIVSNGVRLSNMVNDVLYFSKIKENAIELKNDQVDLFKLSRKVLNSCESLVALKKIEMHSEITREVRLIKADERRVEHIIYNIVNNSISHTKAGSVIIGCAEKDINLELIIRVTGSDLDEAAFNALLKAYEHGGTVGGNDEDVSDLSLAIAKRLAELHGSPMIVDFEDNSMIYRLRFPFWEGEASLTAEEALEMDALINLQPVLDEITSDRNIEILIAGKDVEELQILKSHLSSMNYSVVPMLSGADLLNRVKKDVPHLVVIDVKLPDMSGYEVCVEIRKVFPKDELPVILVINKEDVSDMMEGLTSGANDFLTRPYIQEEFLTRVNTHLQLSRISNIYSRFVPTEFLSSLGQENITDVELGDQVSREMTILFVDIRAFTNLSENMTPEENFKFINSYLSRFSPMISENGGFVDKFIGDAIMALFPNKPENALAAAREMIEHVNVYNGHRANCGYRPINIGIGIHTGNMILGIIGDERRMQGTVISDAVNLASRIQDVTKLYKANVVISQETFVKLENPIDYNFRFLGRVKVKGKDKAVALFEIFDADNEDRREKKNRSKVDFEEGIMKFSRQDFTEAQSLLEKVAEADPDDETAKVFLERIDEMRRAQKKAFLTSL